MIDFNEHIPLVYFVYKKRFGQHTGHKDDLIQEGYIALLRACKMFNLDRKNKFSTYATKAIYNAMLGYIIKEVYNHSNCDLVSEIEEDSFYDNNYESEFSMFETLSERELMELVYRLASSLNDRNKEIVISSLIKDISQVELSKKYKLSQPTISRIVTGFKNQIKEELNVYM